MSTHGTAMTNTTSRMSDRKSAMTFIERLLLGVAGCAVGKLRDAGFHGSRRGVGTTTARPEGAAGGSTRLRVRGADARGRPAGEPIESHRHRDVVVAVDDDIDNNSHDLVGREHFIRSIPGGVLGGLGVEDDCGTVSITQARNDHFLRARPCRLECNRLSSGPQRNRLTDIAPQPDDRPRSEREQQHQRGNHRGTPLAGEPRNYQMMSGTIAKTMVVTIHESRPKSSVAVARNASIDAIAVTVN